MRESSEQSNLLGNSVSPVAPGEYLLNKAKIAEAKALISAYEEKNEAGKQSHDELARELEQKIREGEQARELLLQLRSQPAMDYPSSSSRIDEVPNYDSSSGHSQQVHYQQFQGIANQQTYNVMPQVPVQPVASSSNQKSNPQQWIPGDPNSRQPAQQYLPFSQQPIMQNISTFSQGSLSRKTTDTTSQLATTLGPQSNLNSGPMAFTSPNPVSTNPIANPNGDHTSVLNQNLIHDRRPLSRDPTTLPSIHKHQTKSVRQIATPSAPPQTELSASQIPISVGKRRRETETGTTTTTEPQPKSHNIQQASGQVVADVGPSYSYTVGQATPAVQKPNVHGASTTSLMPRETQQISQALSSSSGHHQQPVGQPQPSTPARLQFSFTGGLGLGPGPSSETPQKNEPLFLPSPVSSPSPSVDANDNVSIFGPQSATASVATTRSCDLRKFSRSAKRKNHVFVLAPRRPPYLVKYFQLEKQKMGKRISSRSSISKNHVFVLAPRRPPYLVKYFQMEKQRIGKRITSRSSLSLSLAEDFYNSTENLSPSYAEQQAIQLACSRLQMLSCKWDGCLVKMNSVDALIHHLNRQHKPLTSHSNQFFLCRWTQCGRRSNFHEKHLEKHASLPLNCPYEDCEESFRSAPILLKHTKAEHKHDEVKPSTQLWYPKVKLPDVVLGVIPSYMITTRGVDPYEISSARHAILAPRILRDISGLERERSKNKSKKTVRSNGDINPDEEDYDFLNARPTRYSSQLSRAVDMQLEDLNSEDISRLVNEGLTLWGKEKTFDREIELGVEAVVA